MTATADYATKIAPKSFTHQMRHKGFIASLMQAPRLKDIGRAHGLPPGNHVPVYHIDALPGCPDEWVREPGTFICPVDPAWGLWFDFTDNNHDNTAVIASVKGMNPITGRKLESLAMEKYNDKCPVHNATFAGSDRMCKECGYKWPPQSYISAPNILWWDGFRQADGTVRQFFFTEDEERDVASHIIGKKNTVPAFGFVFYEPKVRRVVERSRGRGIGGSSVMGWSNTQEYAAHHASGQLLSQVNISHHYEEKTSSIISMDGADGVSCSCVVPKGNSSASSKGILRSARLSGVPQQVYLNAVDKLEDKDVSVGAGAEITQDLAIDNSPLSDWKEGPSAVIRLYFVFRKRFEKIVKKGVVDLDGSKDGYLKGLPVG